MEEAKNLENTEATEESNEPVQPEETEEPTQPEEPAQSEEDEEEEAEEAAQPEEEEEDEDEEDEDEEDEEEEDLEENMSDNEDELKKLEDCQKKDYLLDIHTELKQINHIELDALSRIIRDKDGNIIDELHKTIPFLTKYERARILGLRTKQINKGSAIFVKADKDIIDGYNIALLELEQKKIPFIIQRPLPNGGSEYWNVSDLEIIDY